MLKLNKLYMDYQRLNDDVGVKFCATRHPVFSWSIDCSNTEERQIAFSISISSHDSAFHFSKTVKTADQRFQYDGPALPLGQELHVAIKVVTEQGEYSLGARSFYAVCLDKWPAKWICGAEKSPRERPLYFRKPFKVQKTVKHAMLYVCGIGYHRVWLNGKLLTENRPLEPAFTDYTKRCLYVVYPISENDLNEEGNCIGVEVGLGWRDNANLSYANGNAGKYPFRGDPCLTAFLMMKCDDGSEECLMTDDSWECGTGPMVYADVFNGCVFDARLNKPAWATSRFRSKSFAKAALCPAPGGRMEPTVLSPIVPMPPLTPVATWQLGNKWLYDFGQNIAGVLKFENLDGLGKNDTVTIRHSEELDANGDLFTAPLRTAKATDVYVANGQPGSAFMPYFTYHGFRYASIEAPEEFMTHAHPLAVPLRNKLDKDNFFR
ncbi:MAG: family 78 glycoside hydrolase catalytic domain, partial [Victivallales bacterium]|nr:family 78 glycoside hydrolase catalytic domain [Victivallales bacterium]